MRPRSEIDPDRLYALSEARDYIPGGRGGKRLSPSTLHRWHARGLLKCVVRVSADSGRRAWLVRGSALLDFLDTYQEPGSNGPVAAARTPAARGRDVERAEHRARELGLTVS